jgi:putative Mg2+ transporter-C (MgtC) family protein
MEIFWTELTAGFPDREGLARILIRVFAAMVLGAVIGFQRESMGKDAGLRTHILVAMGTALFVIACISVDMGLDGLSRVIQGIATGIGFIGTGTILKRTGRSEIRGLTTAAGLFMTAAVGVAVGLGRIGIGILGTILAWIVLSAVAWVEVLISPDKSRSDGEPSSAK